MVTNKLKKRLMVATTFLALVSCGKEIKNNKGEGGFNPQATEGIKPITVSRENMLKLEKAIEAKWTSLVSAALLDSEHIDYHFDDGQTPLTKTFKDPIGFDGESIQMLLNKSKNVNLKNKYGEAPIHLVLKRNYNTSAFIIELMTRGADINLLNQENESPLYLAMVNADQDLAMKFIKHGADLSTKSPDGLTMIQEARRLRLRQTHELISQVTLSEELTDEVFNKHIGAANIDYVEYLLFNRNKSSFLNTRNTLITAMNIKDKKDQIKMINLLLRHGADVNHEEGIPPLHYSALYKKTDALKILVKKNVKPGLKDADGFSALDYAVYNVDYFAVDKILEKIMDSLNDENIEALRETVRLACKNVPSYTSLFRRYHDGDKRIGQHFSSTRKDVIRKLNCDGRRRNSDRDDD